MKLVGDPRLPLTSGRCVFTRAAPSTCRAKKQIPISSVSVLITITTAVLDSHAYSYSSANQRTDMTNADSSYLVYQYDTFGQVTSGVKYWSDRTPVAGQQFGYVFDSIGNRQSTTAGGDQSGNNLRSATYK